ERARPRDRGAGRGARAGAGVALVVGRPDVAVLIDEERPQGGAVVLRGPRIATPSRLRGRRVQGPRCDTAARLGDKRPVLRHERDPEEVARPYNLAVRRLRLERTGEEGRVQVLLASPRRLGSRQLGERTELAAAVAVLVDADLGPELPLGSRDVAERGD